jgi:hypothetical protein
MTATIQVLLLQVRDHDDPMRPQEVECFRRVLNNDSLVIETHNLLEVPLTKSLIDRTDVFFIGGSRCGLARADARFAANVA